MLPPAIERIGSHAVSFPSTIVGTRNTSPHLIVTLAIYSFWVPTSRCPNSQNDCARSKSKNSQNWGVSKDFSANALWSATVWMKARSFVASHSCDQSDYFSWKISPRILDSSCSVCWNVGIRDWGRKCLARFSWLRRNVSSKTMFRRCLKGELSHHQIS